VKQQQQRGTCSAQQRSLGALSLCLRAPLHFHDWRLRLEINESARRTNSKPNIRSSGARGEAFQRTHTLAALKANAHLLHSTPTCPLNFYAPRVTRYLNNCHRSPFDTIYHRFAPSSTVFSALICRLSQISFSLFPWSEIFIELYYASVGPLQVGGVRVQPTKMRYFPLKYDRFCTNKYRMFMIDGKN
jgi:hypothetical protein